MRGRISAQPVRGVPQQESFDAEIVIGRSRECGFQVDDPSVSARHARIHYDVALGRYVLEDLGSRSGTRLDGIEIAGPEALAHLHAIRIGADLELLFQDLDRCAARHGAASGAATPAPGPDRLDDRTIPPRPAPPPAPPPAADPGEPARPPTILGVAAPPRPAPGPDADPTERPATIVGVAPPPRIDPAPTAPEAGRPPTLVGVSLPPRLEPARAPAEPTWSSGPEAAFELVFLSDQSRHPIAEGDHSIGRSTSNQIQRNEAGISRVHAVISVRGGRVFVRDAGSQNGTFVNERRIEAETEVAEGVLLRFGQEHARIEPGLITR